jgi:hypothetical protein
MLATNLILVACVLGASAAAGAASASKPDTGKGLFVARVCVGTDFRPCSGGSSMSLGSDEAMAASTHHAEKRQRVSADEAPMDTAPDTHTPSVILSDADADLFSKLTYEEAAASSLTKKPLLWMHAMLMSFASSLVRTTSDGESARFGPIQKVESSKFDCASGRESQCECHPTACTNTAAVCLYEPKHCAVVNAVRHDCVCKYSVLEPEWLSFLRKCSSKNACLLHFRASNSN